MMHMSERTKIESLELPNDSYHLLRQCFSHYRESDEHSSSYCLLISWIESNILYFKDQRSSSLKLMIEKCPVISQNLSNADAFKQVLHALFNQDNCDYLDTLLRDQNFVAYIKYWVDSALRSFCKSELRDLEKMAYILNVSLIRVKIDQSHVRVTTIASSPFCLYTGAIEGKRYVFHLNKKIGPERVINMFQKTPRNQELCNYCLELNVKEYIKCHYCHKMRFKFEKNRHERRRSPSVDYPHFLKSMKEIESPRKTENSLHKKEELESPSEINRFSPPKNPSPQKNISPSRYNKTSPNQASPQHIRFEPRIAQHENRQVYHEDRASYRIAQQMPNNVIALNRGRDSIKIPSRNRENRAYGKRNLLACFQCKRNEYCLELCTKCKICLDCFRDSPEIPLRCNCKEFTTQQMVALLGEYETIRPTQTKYICYQCRTSHSIDLSKHKTGLVLCVGCLANEIKSRFGKQENNFSRNITGPIHKFIKENPFQGFFALLFVVAALYLCFKVINF